MHVFGKIIWPILAQTVFCVKMRQNAVFVCELLVKIPMTIGFKKVFQNGNFFVPVKISGNFLKIVKKQ